MAMYGKDYQEFIILAETEVTINPKLFHNSQALLDVINIKYHTKYVQDYVRLYLQSKLVGEYEFWS